MRPMTIVEIKDLDFAYNGETVLEDVNLTVRQKDFMAIIGPNGGGKTTLLKLVLGLLPIIAITASAFREQRQEILAAGCNDMVIKPFQAHEIFETMGRFLNIAYIYEPEREAAPSRKVETQLISAMLADLPAELLQELRGATLSLNSDAISAVIERIEPLAPDTANGLRTLLDNMQMGRLQELIEKAG